jgi:hypothetical protein
VLLGSLVSVLLLEGWAYQTPLRQERLMTDLTRFCDGPHTASAGGNAG